MRILVVGMADSIHTARWLSQLNSPDLEVALLPSVAVIPHQDIDKRKILTLVPSFSLNRWIHAIFKRLLGSKWTHWWFSKAVRDFNPDVIHTLEFQKAGYLCNEIKKSWTGKFPTWIATNWGSDIYYFSQFKEHEIKIKEVLKSADFYSAECQRDYEIARDLGLRGKPLPVIPNAGGLHLEDNEKLRKIVPPKDRKAIIVKGYQSTFGRALVAIDALSKISSQIKDYEIFVYSASPEVVEACEKAQKDFGLKIILHPVKKIISHQQMLEMQSRARIYVGVSISDGISTSMLEAMAAGAFPIQTCTSCANEWIEDGKSGFIVDPKDSEKLSQLILEAVKNDELVTRAAETNWQTIKSRASFEQVANIAQSFYRTANNTASRVDGAVQS